MAEVTRYDEPYPPVSEPLDDRPSCVAVAPPWACTRTAGHDGGHEAGDDENQLLASWPQDGDSR